MYFRYIYRYMYVHKCTEAQVMEYLIYTVCSLFQLILLKLGSKCASNNHFKLCYNTTLNGSP